MHMAKKLTQEEFIKRAKTTHGLIYDYSKVVYTNTTTKVTLTCKVHGDFLQIPKSHMKGHGCHQCKKDKQCLSKETFIASGLKVHHNKYMYNLVSFRTTKDIVDIICPIHGVFNQTVANHLAGRGCAQCWQIRSGARYFNKPTTLYYIKIFTTNGPLYKIGITTRTVKERYIKELISYQILHTKQYLNGMDAFITEQQILNKNTTSNYTGATPFLWTGTTELFTIDILNKDTNE